MAYTSLEKARKRLCRKLGKYRIFMIVLNCFVIGIKSMHEARVSE